MPALPLNEAFTARALGLIWDAYKNSMGIQPYLGAGFFPKEKTSTMDLKWFKGSKGLPVSLTPSNYDAQATLRDRIGFKEIEMDMPFFRESYLIKEKDAQEYENVMNAADGAIAKELLKQISLGPIDLVQGANVVPERMIWQLLCPTDGSPKIAISANGVKYDYNYDADGSYKANNFMELSGNSQWSDLENSNPIEDLMAAKKAMRKKGKLIVSAVMNDNTWQKVVQNKKVRDYIVAKSTMASIFIEGSDVKKFIKQSEDLQLDIIVYEKLFKDNAGKDKTFIPDGMVALLPGRVALGATKYGKTPEERSGDLSTGNLQIVETGVSLYTFTNPHPIVTQCICSEIVLPTYERMDDTYVIKAYEEAAE
ncbi:major capsid protein [uncultured Robinsoniella sp.]|uniref:major capsid protein n=1 Tax=uncultured Robinsoniella sp. TaxID=904190 RepID=UPI00205C15B7|nr:MAG TPA: capsid protein [Caudoviricetes sp.]